MHCIVDGIGDGIEVDYRTGNAQSVVFSVDDVRASDTASASGIQRIPFTCDGHPHTVTVEAFGTDRAACDSVVHASRWRRAAPQPMPR